CPHKTPALRRNLSSIRIPPSSPQLPSPPPCVFPLPINDSIRASNIIHRECSFLWSRQPSCRFPQCVPVDLSLPLPIHKSNSDRPSQQPKNSPGVSGNWGVSALSFLLSVLFSVFSAHHSLSARSSLCTLILLYLILSFSCSTHIVSHSSSRPRLFSP